VEQLVNTAITGWSKRIKIDIKESLKVSSNGYNFLVEANVVEYHITRNVVSFLFQFTYK